MFSSFKNNTRNIYYFINNKEYDIATIYITKTESVIYPTQTNLILCTNLYFL